MRKEGKIHTFFTISPKLATIHTKLSYHSSLRVLFLLLVAGAGNFSGLSAQNDWDRKLSAARSSFQGGDFEQADLAYEDLCSVPKESLGTTEEISLLQEWIEIKFQLRKTKEVNELLLRSDELLKKNGSTWRLWQKEHFYWGRYFIRSRNPDSSLSRNEKSLLLVREHAPNNLIEQSRCLKNISIAHWMGRDMPAADEAISRALNLQARSDSIDWVLRSKCLGQKVAVLMQMEQLDSVDYFLELQTSAAANIRSGQGTREQKRATEQLGTFRKNKYDFPGAIEAYEQLVASGKPDLKTAHGYLHIAQCYRSMGELEEYERNLELGRLTLDELGADSIEYFYYFLGKGNIGFEKGEFETALQFYVRTENLIRSRNPGDTPNILLALINQVYALTGQGNYGEAETRIRSVLRKEATRFGDLRILAECRKILGNTLLKSGQIAAARQELQRAQQEFMLSGLPAPGDLEAERLLCSIRELKGDTEGALEGLNAIISACVEGFEPDSPLENPSIDEVKLGPPLLSALVQKAKLLSRSEKQERLEVSLSTFELAAELKQQLQEGFRQEESKLRLAERQFPLHEAGIGVAKGLHNLTGKPEYLHRAFSIAEKSKATLMLAQLSRDAALYGAGVPDSLVRTLNGLRLEVGFLKRKIWEERDKGENARPERIAQWETSLEGQLSRLRNWEEFVAAAYPEYGESKGHETISVEELQDKWLGEGQVLLEYLWGDSLLYTFIVTQNSIELVEIGNLEQLEADIRDLQKALRANPPTLQSRKVYLEKATYLYEILFGPIRDQLADRKVTLIPDGVLGYIPFEALLTRLPAKNVRYNAYPYLLWEMQLSYEYSASLMAQNRRRHKEGKNKFAAFSPTFALRNDSLAELDLLRQTADELGKKYKGRVFSGAEATHTLFRERARDFNILMLATHAFTFDENPRNSYFAMAAPGEKSDGDNLYAYELNSLPLRNANLVITTACNTGRGSLVRGEGIMSLARSFSLAGCPSVLMSLWEVSSAEPTRKITMSFMDNLAEGMGKDEALREAKMSFLKDARGFDARPFLWAELVVVGDVSPLKMERDYSWGWMGAGLGMLLLLLAGIWRKKKQG